MSVALGPLGRNGEASGSLNTSGKVAAMYSYSKTRGLFGGLSIEGSVLVERQDANANAYNSDVTAKMLLSGAVDVPDWATPLTSTLESCVGIPGGKKWVKDSLDLSERNGYAFGDGIASPGSEQGPSTWKKGHIASASLPTNSGSRKKPGDSYFDSEFGENRVPQSRTRKLIDDGSAAKSFPEHFDSDFNPQETSPKGHPHLSSRKPTPSRSSFVPDSPFNDLPPFPVSSKNSYGHDRTASSASYLTGKQKRAFPQDSDPFSTLSNDIDDVGDINHLRILPKNTISKPHIAPKAGLTSPLDPTEGVARAIALFDFKGIQYGDLSFKKGQVITITKKTNKVDDWWSGKTDGGEGIFPANFVEVV